MENVKAGKYSLRGQRTGFADTVIDGITLAARQDLRFTLSMAVAAQQTTVEVTSSAAEINTENATVGDSKNTTEIGQLPLNFRASTTSPLAALATSANVQQDSQGNFTIGGATSNMIGFSVDGISSVNIFQSGVALGVNAAGSNPYPSSEGIAELKVTAFNNNAEFSQVGDVTFTTKAGTNQFHGSLFEYLQNDVLNAKVYNFAEKAPSGSIPLAAAWAVHSRFHIFTTATTKLSSSSTTKAIAEGRRRPSNMLYRPLSIEPGI